MTALSLAHLRPELAGDILLLEARSFPREKICGGGVSGRVTAFLESLGVSLDTIPRVSVQRLTICFEADKYYAPFGNEGCCVIRRSAFDHLLLKEAEERGVEVRTSTPAVGAYRERKGIVVLDKAGNTYHSEVLVGADGVNGRSRTWFGVPHKSRKTLLLQTDFPRDPDEPSLRDSLVLDFSPPQFDISGYAWFFPSVGEEGEPVVNAGISGGEFGHKSHIRLREAFFTILDRHPEIKVMAPRDIPFKAYPEQCYAIFQTKARERVIFVGEQLGVDSFTGEGLAICAESAMAAALDIVHALDGGDLSFKNYSKGLRRSEFFPLFLIGKPFWMQPNGPGPSLFLAMATRKPPPGRENVLDIYARVFSGASPGKDIYTHYFLRTVLRDIAGVLSDRLRYRGVRS